MASSSINPPRPTGARPAFRRSSTSAVPKSVRRLSWDDACLDGGRSLELLPQRSSDAKVVLGSQVALSRAIYHEARAKLLNTTSQDLSSSSARAKLRMMFKIAVAVARTRCIVRYWRHQMEASLLAKARCEQQALKEDICAVLAELELSDLGVADDEQVAQWTTQLEAGFAARVRSTLRLSAELQAMVATLKEAVAMHDCSAAKKVQQAAEKVKTQGAILTEELQTKQQAGSVPMRSLGVTSVIEALQQRQQNSAKISDCAGKWIAVCEVEQEQNVPGTLDIQRQLFAEKHPQREEQQKKAVTGLEQAKHSRQTLEMKPGNQNSGQHDIDQQHLAEEEEHPRCDEQQKKTVIGLEQALVEELGAQKGRRSMAKEDRLEYSSESMSSTTTRASTCHNSMSFNCNEGDGDRRSSFGTDSESCSGFGESWTVSSATFALQEKEHAGQSRRVEVMERTAEDSSDEDSDSEDTNSSDSDSSMEGDDAADRDSEFELDEVAKQPSDSPSMQEVQRYSAPADLLQEPESPGESIDGENDVDIQMMRKCSSQTSFGRMWPPRSWKRVVKKEDMSSILPQPPSFASTSAIQALVLPGPARSARPRLVRMREAVSRFRSTQVSTLPKVHSIENSQPLEPGTAGSQLTPRRRTSHEATQALPPQPSCGRGQAQSGQTPRESRAEAELQSLRSAHTSQARCEMVSLPRVGIRSSEPQ
mmetsp:Transcript_45111/g.107258  ORF Transcript_45111/g.107258 Transcript_45111/m.107258 type:complete len:705 (-) Transcript_45111:202-2316(-)